MRDTRDAGKHTITCMCMCHGEFSGLRLCLCVFVLTLIDPAKVKFVPGS